MEERILSELTRAQIEYTTIHISNFIDLCVYERELSRADLLEEQHAAQRFVNIYKAKYRIDKNTSEALMRYMNNIPMVNLYTNNNLDNCHEK